MTPVSDQSRVDEIVRLVEQYLSPHQPKDGSFKLTVIRGGIQEEDDWVYVTVRPEPESVRTYDYYGRLAEAESDLEEKESVKVLLVPAIPG
ncbi:MAG: hypothetical protein HOP29_12950 [Phycisphaerales bacterium]|nr:hypothetical protein [Phycisphaerales bacterium]